MKKKPPRASRRRKAFGQHFLKDKNVISKIVHAAELIAAEAPRQMVEIGPGRGALTHALQGGCLRVDVPFLAIEKDSRLIAGLVQSKIQVLEKDFLKATPNDWLPGLPVVFVSNLPYSAGTAILNLIHEWHTQRQVAVLGCVFMFQAEVADRLLARVGNREDRADIGSLTLAIQNAWDVSLVAKVGTGAFEPPPQVQSKVVRLIPRESPRVSASPEFETLIAQAFSQRRKMLRAVLQGPFKRALDASGLDATKRAEALSWEEWEKLWSTHLNSGSS